MDEIFILNGFSSGNKIEPDWIILQEMRPKKPIREAPDMELSTPSYNIRTIRPKYVQPIVKKIRPALHWPAIFITLFIPKSFRTTKSIYGEIALVTGAGSGIGRLISIHLAKLGAKVVMWDVNTAGLESTKAQIEDEGGEASMYFCDVTDRVQVYETAERVRREVGDVSVLVNNAGIVNGKWFLDIPDEKIEKVMEVNVIAHFWTLKAFLPHMMTLNHGHIVTISSIAGRSPTARLVDYYASKYGALGLHESLAVELRALGKDGIQLTNICPFFINTGMFEGAKARLPFLLPLTEPEYVAQRVVSAILLNQYQVYIPRSLYFLMPLRALLPRKAIIAVEDFLGVQEFMSSKSTLGRGGNQRSSCWAPLPAQSAIGSVRSQLDQSTSYSSNAS